MVNQHSPSSPVPNEDPADSPPPAAAGTDTVSPATHAELAAIVLSSQPLGAVLRRVAQLAVKTIPGADDASVTLIERGRPRTVAFNGPLAISLDERQYELGFGPCLDAAISGQTILLDTHDEHVSYPEFAREARRAGIRHVLSIGMPALQHTSSGLNLYCSGPVTAFDPQSLAEATAFAGYAAVTIFNAALYAGAVEEVAQMQQAMTSRAGIEQAKGIIMAQQRCSADEAFAILVDTSSRTNRKLREVAADVIADAIADPESW
jgi:GAF domain-containing protein